MKDPMLFGHNTNVKVRDTDFHVQTEDRGVTNALIDTTVYFQGRVLHRRTNNYFDLLPLNSKNEQALKQRLDEQHRAVVEELRTGTLHLPLPQEAKSPATTGVSNAPSVTIIVNGESRVAGVEATVADLLRDLGLNAGRVAIERNLEILPRPKWPETRVAAGDRYEIVQFVGGG